MGWYPCECCGVGTDLIYVTATDVVKINAAGTVQWTTDHTSYIPASHTVLSAAGICTDSAGLSMVGLSYYDGGTGYVGKVLFLNAAGTIGSSLTTVVETIYDLSVDGAIGSSYFYVAGASNGAGTGSVVLERYNSTPTQQWQKTASGYAGIAVDSNSSGRVVLGMSLNAGTTVFCYNSAGTQQWTSTVNNWCGAIRLDTSGNAFGITGTSGGSYYLRKWASSGTELSSGNWPVNLGTPAGLPSVGISIDSGDDVYVTVGSGSCYEYDNDGGQTYTATTGYATGLGSGCSDDGFFYFLGTTTGGQGVYEWNPTNGPSEIRDASTSVYDMTDVLGRAGVFR